MSHKLATQGLGFPGVVLALLLAVTGTRAQFAFPEDGQTLDSPERIGVLYLVHGAGRTQHFSHFFDAAIQIAHYNPHSSTYRNTIWNPDAWPSVVPLADKERVNSLLGLYRRSTFEFGRLGNLQPATQITEAQTASLQKALDTLATDGPEFITDWVAWITGTEDVEHLPYPRFVYNRDGASPIAMRYCGGPGDGGAPPDGRWPQCNPERYNVDGPMDRLLAQGVTSIILVDTAVGGVRFSKTFDIYRMLRRARDAALEGTNRTVPMVWANDPTELIAASYPTEPADWTTSLGPPLVDPKVPLQGRPNPVTDNPRYAAIYAKGIIQAMRGDIAAANTGVLLFNHGIYPGNERFDPKINDTLTLNRNLEQALLKAVPGMRADNIVGGWEGIREEVDGMLQRTRAMRGEDLGHAFLYESEGAMPPGKWGLRYWDALERLRDNGVQHLVIAFPQSIYTTTVGQVGLPNQMAKEIGYRSFRAVENLAVPLWPGFDSPFNDFWPPAAPLLCAAEDGTSYECCYAMSGCANDRTYPEARQTPADQAMSRIDPALVFDVPPFGHLGYDPTKGPSSADGPVQDQYTGTWSIWVPLDNDPDLARYLAEVVVDTLEQGE